MIVCREEKWGKIEYNTENHSFSYYHNEDIDAQPYSTQPLVLNVDLTFKCNMACLHCVAEDMAKTLGGAENADLVVSDELIKKINNSPFMVIVLTGGEPLLGENYSKLIKIIKGLKNKAIIIDTNGTIFPPGDILQLIIKKEILVRVSWDIPHPTQEVKLRKYPKNLYIDDVGCMRAKEKFINGMIKNHVQVAIQSVLHRYNYNNSNFFLFPHKLYQMGIKDWYIQRFIPSHKQKKAMISIKEYNNRVGDACKAASEVNIRCHHKKDQRHNSVFLLVKDGDLYTQHNEKPGEKIKLGKIDQVDYFAFVSNADHMARYMA